jgi:hypothetical protein
LTTPENTDEVLCILSTIKLEYDLDAVDQKWEGCQVKVILLRNPYRKKKIILNKALKMYMPSFETRTYIPGHTISAICKNPRRGEIDPS